MHRICMYRSSLPSLLDFKLLEVCSLHMLYLTCHKSLSYIDFPRAKGMKWSNTKVLAPDRRHLSPSPSSMDSSLRMPIRLQLHHGQNENKNT